MSLLRLMQQNGTASSPAKRDSPASTRHSTNNSTPARARPRPSLVHSPASTPSISSSVPFDWDAARARRPPPYATPQGKRPSRLSGLNNSATPARERKGIVKKKSWFAKLQELPNTVMFEISQFPENVPMPETRMTAFMAGGALHLFNLIVRIYQSGDVPDSDRGWEDMYREHRGTSWFSWTLPATILLVAAAFLNALYLFTRVRVYRLNRRPEPVASPNARFVPTDADMEPAESASVYARLGKGSWYLFMAFWRFLLGMQPPPPSRRTAKVQQLEMWHPGELEMSLFCIYGPAHPFLWMATGSSNWIVMVLVMGLVGLQSSTMVVSWKALLKDKDILASEVMHEYNEGFVYPRVNPIRKDAATMTHESEMVNAWE